MVTRQRQRAIQALARKVLIEHDAMHLPVVPKAFAAEKLSIQVESFDPTEPDISGFLMRMDDRFGIGYSTAIASKGFQNFTVAHELGHYFIDGHFEALLNEGLHMSRSGYISQDTYEREADIFATEFLMPWKLISPIATRSVQGFPAIKAIADQCESSIIASAIRYTSVAKEPVAVVVSHDGVIEFMSSSDSFRQMPGIRWLRRGDRLPPAVPSVEFASRAEWIANCATVEEGTLLSQWFSSAPNVAVEEDIVGLGNYGRLLTVLIAEWEEDEEELEESGDDYIDRWRQGGFRGKNG
jgi:hypothetical protein